MLQGILNRPATNQRSSFSNLPSENLIFIFQRQPSSWLYFGKEKLNDYIKKINTFHALSNSPRMKISALSNNKQGKFNFPGKCSHDRWRRPLTSSKPTLWPLSVSICLLYVIKFSTIWIFHFFNLDLNIQFKFSLWMWPVTADCSKCFSSSWFSPELQKRPKMALQKSPPPAPKS